MQTPVDITPTGKREDAFERHYPDALRFALLMTGDEGRAEAAVILSFSRCFARFDHLRDDAVFETSLLREVWRAAIPRVGRRAQVPRAAEALSRLGFPEAQISAVLPSAREDMWAAPTGQDADELPEAVPDRESLRRALRGGRRRLVAMLTAACLLGASTTAIALKDGSTPERTDLVAPDLPDLLPQSYEPRGPRIQVVRGTLRDQRWMVNAYAAARKTVCIELRVGKTYGDVHCPSNFEIPIRGFVGPDRKHRTTFIYGYVRSDVTDVSIKEVTSAPVGIQVGRNPEALGFKEPGGFFAVTVPDYLLQLSSKEQGEQLGYTTFALRLRAFGAGKKRLGVHKIFLGRPN